MSHLWLAAEPLVLASRSAARHAILQAAGVPCEVRPADIDERALERAAGAVTPDALAAMLADAKAQAVALAQAVAHTAPPRLVLGADQVLAFGGKVFSKPADKQAARAQLCTLRGETHALHAAIVLRQGERCLFQHVATARLTMRRFSNAFLDQYLAAMGERVCDSVGGYQLEEQGIHLFERIEGDYFTILGLPLLPLLAALRQNGYVRP